MVFSPNLFKYFPVSSQPVSEIVEWNGQNRTVIRSPKVLEAAKKHFNCNSIKGVEVEDQGGSGSVEHWESRVMLGDYMVSSDYRERAISEMTLGLFEDSGWYKVNHYSGGLFRYGKNRGCDFIDKKCIIEEKSNFDEFCTEPSEPMCYPGHLSKGLCYLVTNIPNIPERYQYWSDKTKGGFTPADYCPVAIHYRIKQQDYRFAGHCEYGYDENSTIYGETYGKSSICFTSTLLKDGSHGIIAPKPICHKVTCGSDYYTVTIDGNEVKCDKDKKTVTVPGYSGELQWVDIIRVCTGTTFCNDIFSCIEAKSISIQYEPLPIKGNYYKISYLLVIGLLSFLLL